MLVTLAVSPSSFGAKSVVQIEQRYAAEAMLDALLENAVAITAEKDFAAQLSANIGTLNVRLGQQLSIRAAELTKTANRALRVIHRPAGPQDAVNDLIAAAQAGADAIVCSCSEDVLAARSALGPSATEVLLLADYPRSKTESLRRSYCQSVELHPLSAADCQCVIGRALQGAGRIQIADKMLGPAGKDGKVTSKLERFARGVIYVATCAAARSMRLVEIEIITAAGSTGAKSGFVDPALAERAIRSAVGAADTKKVLGQLHVTLKAETDPPIFRDRLLACSGRCWGIRHGIDDLGALTLDPKRRSPTFLDPDSPANRRLLAAIVQLKQA